MSFIPNCRAKFDKDVQIPFRDNKDIPEYKINPYWGGLLEGEDREFVAGFDWNTSFGLNNMFDNLEIFEDELKSIGINVDEIDKNIVNGADEDNPNDDREIKWFSDYTDEEISNMNYSTKVMLMFKYMTNLFVESERDELITSMIDNMDEDKHRINLETFEKEEMEKLNK